MQRHLALRGVTLILCLLSSLALFQVPAAAGEPGELYVAVGYGGRRIVSRDRVLWEHDQRWSDEARDDDNVLFDIAYGAPVHAEGLFVAVGGGASVGHILTTRDGITWLELPKLRGRVATVAFGRQRFVAAHGAELLWSDDGQTFTSGEKLGIKGSVHARKSAFGDGEGGAMYVIMGDVDLSGENKRVGWRASTTDGQTFASQAVDTPEARDIAYGAGHFVVVGPAGLIESSHDGQTWRRREVDPEESFESVVWTGTGFLAAGKKMWVSRDGLAWSAGGARSKGQPAWAQSGVGAIAFSWGGRLYHAGPDLAPYQEAALQPGPSLVSVAFRPAR